MQANVDIPYEFEAMALYLGVTPKEAATALLDWFTMPMAGTGLLIHPYKRRSRRHQNLTRAMGEYVERQKLSRSVVMDTMIHRAQMRQL